jgi:hypothetical protein
VTRTGASTLRRAIAKRAPRWPRSRDRRVVPAVAAAVLLVAVAVGLWATLRSGDEDPGSSADAAADQSVTSTSMVTGGIEVDLPDATVRPWRAVPLPQLGFGLAIPADWEAVVLSDEALADLAGATPAVPGFLEAAHAARQTGAVFYAAGADDQGEVTDLKVRAEPGTGITDVAGLEAYVRQLAAEAGVTNPEIVIQEAFANPTVDAEYAVTAEHPSDPPGPAPVRLRVRGTDRVVLSPRGVVYSLIITREDPTRDPSLVYPLLETLAFPPAA